MSDPCSTPGCPAPKDAAWHEPWCRRIKGHKCFGGPTHQHLPKRGMGGHNPNSKIVACLCAGMHDAVDNGFKYGNAVIVDGEGREVYRLWEVTIEPPGKTLIERVIDEGGGRAADELGCDRVQLPTSAEMATGFNSQLRRGATPAPPSDHPPDSVCLAGAYLRDLPPGDEGEPGIPAVVTPAVAHYDRRALVLEGALSWERYEELCGWLEVCEEAVGFWIGDLIIRGEQEFGERAYQPWTAKGYKAERLRQYAWVASHVGVYARKDELSFTYHREVAALPEPEQVALLDRAEAEHLSTRELREIVKGAKPEETCHHSWKCELCGASLRGR